MLKEFDGLKDDILEDDVNYARFNAIFSALEPMLFMFL